MLRLAKKSLAEQRLNPRNAQALDNPSNARKPQKPRVRFEPDKSVTKPFHERLTHAPYAKDPVNGQIQLSTNVALRVTDYFRNNPREIQSAIGPSNRLAGDMAPAESKENGATDITRRSYPTDLVHGLLSAHCASETGKEAGNSKVRAGDTVVFSADHSLRGMFEDSPGKDLNAYVADWRVCEVIEGEQTGYCGIVYVNEKAKQTVLAHRSTNFALGLTTKNLGKQSGVQTDIESVLMGRIVTHQAHGYIATDEAIKIARKNKTTLSITGHSLGAWLAQLSIYYCHTGLGYKNVKAVTFDGPGALEMMEQMSASEVRGSRTTFKDLQHELDIVSYLSAPNIVNCTNKHVGRVYRLFPDIGKSTIPAWMRKVVGSGNEDAVVATMGHHLKHILPHFNTTTGIPDNHRRVVKWPSIIYRESGHDEQNLFEKQLKQMVADSSFIGRLSTKVLDIVTTKVLGSQATTTGSVFYLLRDRMNGHIREDQFWKVHEFLSREEGYKAVTQDKVEDFELLFKGQYQVEVVNEHEGEVIDEIDKYLKNIKLHEEAILKGAEGTLRQGLASLVKQYDFRRSDRSIAIKEGNREVTISKLRDKMRILRGECQEALDKCINAAKNVPVELHSNIPFSRNRNIVRRQEPLEQVAKLHAEDPVVVVSGVGGVGKSVFAAEYGYLNQDQDRIVRWVKGAGKLENSYRSIAKELGLGVDGRVEVPSVVSMVYARLATMRPCLLVLDNVENVEEVQDYLVGLPKNVRILITTRKHHFRRELHEVELTPFTAEQGLGFISRVLNVAKEQAQKLLDAVGALPLRLDIATAYIADNTNLSSIEDFVARFESLKTSDSKLRPAMEIVLEKVRGSAWDVLHWSAYLDPDFIPIKLFEHLGVPRTELQEVTKLLERSSLAEVVTNSDGEHGLRVHRFIQTEVRDYAKLRSDVIKKAEEEVLAELAECLITLMPDVDESLADISESWNGAKLYSSLVEILLSHIKKNNLSMKKDTFGTLSLRLGFYNYHIVGLDKEALVWFNHALEIFRTCYGSKHPRIALTLNCIGNTYRGLGEYHKNLKYQMRALEMYQSLYPSNHLDVARCLLNIGTAYDDNRDSHNALTYKMKALKMHEALCLGVHPHVANSLNSVGHIYRNLGDYHKALDYFAGALAIYQALYSGNHPYIATFLGNIGAVYDALGEHRKALEYEMQALNMRKTLFPNNHPDVANSLNNIGGTHYSLGEYRKGLEYLMQALNIRKDLFPNNHPDIALSLYNIGATHHSLGEYRKALEYEIQALEMYKALFPNNHLDVADSLNSIGMTYEKLGDKEKALDFYNQAYKMRVDLFGPTHERTLLVKQKRDRLSKE